jgi:hypothetical protein
MAAIDIGVEWQSGAIGAVHIRARTPHPGPLLVGLAPPAVAGLLGRLYAVCGAAQRACAELALSAATAHPLAPERHRRLATEVAAEAIQEHLWRLWIDWPAALSLPPQQGPFTHWYGAIRSEARDWPANLCSMLERDWLGRPAAALALLARPDAFGHWLATDPSPAARLFAALRAEPAAAPRATAQAPATADTPISTTRAHAWVAALEDAGRTLEALLASRVVALAARLAALLTDPPSLVDLAAASPGPGRGLGSVGTARGRLEHDVTLAGGHVASYSIRTPTERHFSAGGPYVAHLRGRPATDPAAARRIATLWALGFDPCVTYAVAGDGHA